MQLDRLELIEKAFNMPWCKKNFVLPDINVVSNDGEGSITVYISDLKHLSVLGEFIAARLKSECGFGAKFEEADAGARLGFFVNEHALRHQRLSGWDNESVTAWIEF